MPNEMTVGAMKRLYCDAQVTITAASFKWNERPTRIRLEQVKLRYINDPDKAIHITTEELRRLIRYHVVDGKELSTGEHMLFFSDDWTWKPAPIRVGQEDIKDLEALLVGGSKQQRYDPDWRLYGAGLTNVRYMNNQHGFSVAISELGIATLEAERKMSADEIRAEYEEQLAEQRRETEKWYLRPSEPEKNGDGYMIRLHCHMFPNVTLTINTGIDKLYFDAGWVDMDEVGTYGNFGKLMEAARVMYFKAKKFPHTLQPYDIYNRKFVK